MLWGIICDVILRHNNNNKCQHHIILQKNVIFSIAVTPYNQQSSSFKTFSKLGKYKVAHHGKTKLPRSNLEMREIILGKKLLLTKKTRISE